MIRSAISVLDSVPIGPGVSARQAVMWSTELAQAAEGLGCCRYWVVEHHAVADTGSTAPPVMIAHLASHTSRIRVGAGGVMLPNHAPLIVAEQFTTLQALYPDRIDLGMGRTRGADERTAAALRRGVVAENGAETFERQLDDLLGFLYDSFESNHPYTGIRVPLKVSPPATYLLGASTDSGAVAGKKGLSYAYAHFLNPNGAGEAISRYRSEFRGRSEAAEPHAIIAVRVVCSSTYEEAESAALAATAVRLCVAKTRGGPSLGENWSSSGFVTERHQFVLKALASSSVFYGTGSAVAARLDSLLRESGANEVMLVPVEYNGPGRLRTIGTLVSEAH